VEAFNNRASSAARCWAKVFTESARRRTTGRGVDNVLPIIVLESRAR
jgi:hypothetical protein